MRDLIKINSNLEIIANRILELEIPLDFDKEWSFYNVVVTSKNHSNSNNKKIRRIVTPYYHELSWLFFELDEIFSYYIKENNRFPIEFFGRLSNVSRFLINKKFKLSIVDMLMFVITEVYVIIDEIKEDSFLISNKSMGEMIIDDIKSNFRTARYKGKK